MEPRSTSRVYIGCRGSAISICPKPSSGISILWKWPARNDWAYLNAKSLARHLGLRARS